MVLSEGLTASKHDCTTNTDNNLLDTHYHPNHIYTNIVDLVAQHAVEFKTRKVLVYIIGGSNWGWVLATGLDRLPTIASKYRHIHLHT